MTPRITGLVVSHTAVAMLLFLPAGCASTSATQIEEPEFRSTTPNRFATQRTRAELQADVLRFETRFIARLNDAFDSIGKMPSSELEQEAASRSLLYMASSLDIALGPVPEKNLLDMIVFVELIKNVFRRHWIPRVYKADGKPVLLALEDARQDLAEVASVYLSANELDEVRTIATDWLRRNPEVFSVELVRMGEFSVESSARAEQLANRIAGLLSPIAAAAETADQALRLGERALYFSQRAPFLLRMQTSLALKSAVQEVQSSLAGDLLIEARKALRTQGRTLVLGLLLAGATLVAFAGFVYVLSRLAYDRYSSKQTPSEEPKSGRRAA